MPSALDRLAAAAQGLLVASESDEPLEPFRWPGPGPLTADALRAHLGLPAATPVERGDPARFFRGQAEPPEDGDAAELASAARFAALGRLFARLLADRTLYRVGEVEVQIFLIGVDADGATVGLRSLLVET